MNASESAPVTWETVEADANLPALSAAIHDLDRSFGAHYPRGVEFLEHLTALEAEQAALAAGHATPARLEAFREAVDLLRREALIANPLVSGQPLLYVSRKQYRSDHHNTATLFQAGEINQGSFEGGGALKCVDLKTGTVTTLHDVPRGLVRDPEVSFDGTRIVFAKRNDARDDYHIYEMNRDGTNLRQLTRASGISDVDPLYLPGGDIAFSSTREPKYCMCNRHIMANLYRMEGDGANIHQIGKSTLFEGHASLLPDGRLLYDRWEYVDRNFGDAQGLWSVYPDGTGHALYWGNNTNSPGGVIDARVIPGTEQVLCVFGSCHDRPWGALAIVDRRRGLDGRAPVIRTWPADAINLVGVGDFDTYKQVMPKYEDPYPLNDRYFLCARMTGNGEEMGIYLLDVFGNELLLHAEAPGCFDPMPLGPRACPPAVPLRRDYTDDAGVFYVADVYRGTHMEGVERGSVKYLRVIESPEKQSYAREQRWGGQGQQNPGMNWHDFNNKRILGTVPVDEDGSAHVAVPADTYVYFQLLDADGMMVQSMRSGTIIQPGERQGCVGCHEPRNSAPPPHGAMALSALERAPDRLEGWHGPQRFFGFRAEVQPVFDRYCVSCHDYGKEAADSLLLCGDTTMTFNTAYVELWRKKLITIPGAGPAEVQQAYSWGSHASRLVQVLREGHHDVALDPESFDRIATWVDINAPYYPYYETAYPDNLGGRAPLDSGQVARLTELTGVPFMELASFQKNQGPQASFERPALSPCLKQFDPQSAAYGEALALIEAGGKQLAARPQADMPGFVPDGTDARHLEKYAQRESCEARNRQALREGKKVYDE
ncbi:hypothetical protein [Roseovarius pacificus]|uniref:HzsA-related protein n=1 Tax=Roseovarius pacificus TaxID=337701 RepID=UPI003747E3D8